MTDINIQATQSDLTSAVRKVLRVWLNNGDISEGKIATQ